MTGADSRPVWRSPFPKRNLELRHFLLLGQIHRQDESGAVLHIVDHAAGRHHQSGEQEFGDGVGFFEALRRDAEFSSTVGFFAGAIAEELARASASEKRVPRSGAF
jgi:hypothetical protein